MQAAIQYVSEENFNRTIEPRAEENFFVATDEDGVALQLVTIRLAHPVSLETASRS